MLTNHWKIAFRNLRRNKAFSFINIVGLSVGLATCLLIMLYIFDENKVDQHHQEKDRLFRVASSTDKGESWAAGPGPLAAGLKMELPEIAEATRLLTFSDIATMLIKYGEPGQQKQFYETNGYYVDSNFFNVLTYDFLYGNAATALDEPNSTVISREMAGKFFGKDDPVGKALLVTTPFGEFSYTVKGVFDNRNKSHIPANFFLSMRNKDMWQWVKQQDRWTTNNIFFTYIKLKTGASSEQVAKKLNPFFQRHAAEGMKAAGFSKTLFLQPVTAIYLHSAIGNEIGANGNITYLYILGSIAAFILVIACINFMNLSTARSQKRAREVGVRKVIGAGRSGLVRQFLGESFILCLIALVVALALAIVLLPVFNQLAQKNLQLFDDPLLIAWIIALTLITGLLAGLYPAFYLSAFKPIAVLKGKIINHFSATAIRKGLVIFQFTVSIALIFGILVIWRQLDLLKNQQLGFTKEHQVVLPLQQAYASSETHYAPLKNELLKNAAVRSVTSGSAYPGMNNLTDMLFYAEGQPENETVDIHLTGIENEYIETLGMQLLSGRSFSKTFTADSASIVLNEAAIKQLGYTPAGAVGKKIFYSMNGTKAAMEIVGVVKDFNFESLHNQIKPCGFTSGLFANKYSYLIASLATDDYANVLAGIEKTWVQLYPGTPFTYSFIDKDFERNYQKERLSSRIILYFTVIAIVIACLGLFGLTAFSAEQRTKEIGIRKVLGASVAGVTAMLSKEFVRLIFIAMLIALPLGWFFMKQWLQDFAYRIAISWWMFLAAGAMAVVIALFTISFQAIKAALANPVKSLRSE